MVVGVCRNSFTVCTAISAASSFGKQNTSVEMQQNAMLSSPASAGLRQAGAAAGAAGTGAGPDMGAGAGQQAGPAPEGFQGDDVVDGDYKEV